MQSRLEDILREKEKELRLHQRFASLVDFCREEVFPFAAAPLQSHVDSLKDFMGKLIPEPKDRREELFSGEVFILLCTAYLHDITASTKYSWADGSEILNEIEGPRKSLLLNSALGRRLEIPEKALALVNSLVFSVRRVPLEWEITEGARKAIVRNGRMLGEIFDFAHHVWDIFSGDSTHIALRRHQSPDLRLRCPKASVTVDSKEGVIVIDCKPELPYQVHVLERVREHLSVLFRRFAENVNGRLGFQYREVVWDVDASYGSLPPSRAIPGTQALPGTLMERWDEAAELLDRLFKYGEAIVVGGKDSGKTSLLNAFVLPQLFPGSPNVFYAEIWDKPVNQIREAIEKASRTPPGGPVDIVSTSKRLLQEGPCFFIIDGCERLRGVSEAEREKLERFVHFCVSSEDVYLIAAGDKEDFIDWYQPFNRASLSAIFEVKPWYRVGRGPERTIADSLADALPERIESIGARPDAGDLKDILWVLAGNSKEPLKRYRRSDIALETCFDGEKIERGLDALEAAGLVRHEHVFDSAYYALASRHAREAIGERLGPDRMAEKRELRQVLKRMQEGGAFADDDTLAKALALKDRMQFTRDEMGTIVAGALSLDRDCSCFLEKAEQDRCGFTVDGVLSLLSHGDLFVRERVVRLLAWARDEKTVNPLLAHLRTEVDPSLRRLLVECFITLGKRKTIVALVKVLTEIEDQEAKIQAIDHIARLPARRARELLIEIGAVEKEPEIIDLIDSRLARLEE